ncbi:membrane protein insertase YidC [Mesoplasma corruscae]|uniref:Membrane protein insertase YidC n=1 Tax=Mesoplasma corruscae TaxID=216874 RepID=A0A2S5RH54_9MOLU|nr:membrane protein insertase YidC [Mesoplasma corruscae]PPE06666.1 membrane protein insertase YidC [Mesoplasma corruscae]
MYNNEQFMLFAKDARVLSYLSKNQTLNTKRTFSEKMKDPDYRKRWIKLIWRWVKILTFLFIIVSMLWGCVQMYQSPYAIQDVTDLTGRKVFSAGISFEIVTSIFGEHTSQNWWNIITGNMDGQQYAYNVIGSWGEAFSKTKSPFYGFFVYPIALLLNSLIYMMSSSLNPELNETRYGIAVIFAMLFTVIIIKSFTLIFTWKSQVNQDLQQRVQLKTADITAKYKGDKSPEAKQKQQREINAIYKKEGFSPFSAMAGAVVTMPFLFATYAIVRSTRSLKVASVGLISLIDKPWSQIKQGEYIYILIIAIYLPLQIFSMLLPLILQSIKQPSSTLTVAQKKSRKKQYLIQGVFALTFIIIIISVASGVAIYWIFSSTFQICQTLGFFFYNKKKANNSSQEINRRRKQQKNRKIKTNNI